MTAKSTYKPLKLINSLLHYFYLIELIMLGTTIRFFVFIFLIGGISAKGHSRIVGGKNALIKHFPYLVSLRKSETHLCGGIIISDRHILTAAHCMVDTNMIEDVTVHSGTSKSNKEGTVHRIIDIHNHPNFDYSNKNGYDDISILTLEEPIVFNKYEQKINLPKHEVREHQVGYVIGWGRYTTANWKSSKQLQKLRVALMPGSKCQSFILNKDLSEKQVCAFRSLGTGICHGDSGGPLVSNGEIVGIASYISGGACAAGPTVFTRIFAYKDFIEEVMRK